MKNVTLLFIVGILTISSTWYSTVFAQQRKIVSEEEYIIKCLYNFSYYIQWPEQHAKNEFVIAVVGEKRLYEYMQQTLNGKRTGMQELQIKYFEKPSEVTGFSHIIYVAEWQSLKVDEIIETNDLNYTLMVTEKEGMTRHGSAINFIPHEGFMHFEICKQNILDRGLKVNSRLEQLAIRAI